MKSRITKEQFSKLNQLDRIEYRQKRDYIERQFEGGLGSWDFLNRMFALMGFIIIIALLVYNINPKYMISIFSILILLIKITIIFFIILITAELIIIYKKNKEKRKLNEEYFNFKIEVKRNETNNRRTNKRSIKINQK